MKDLLEITPTQYRKKYAGSAVSRIKYIDMMRNVFLVIANLDKKELLPEVLAWQSAHLEHELKEYQYCLDKLNRE